ncbi:hypothetical protein H072_7214 [Dactylellina haptotyla CBS 200.50]|uniref:Uncharacterized protein n=1 Tax=Dactylellina haptotyla (strain CBS 200.50) TaxID=1284197 RepID=S8A7N4_DACHA|nr:hypothetical protein H072_7214 [Dactylellina haptotyla CBS 200.50]
MSDSAASQSTSTPSRPVNRNRQSKSSPQVPTSGTGGKKNFNNGNRGNRRFNGNAQNGQNGQKRESALTKKFREAAQDNGANSDSAVHSIIEKGMVTPPATPGPTGRREPNAYVSDSAIGAQAEANKKKNFKNKNKKGGRRTNEIPMAAPQSITPPQEPAAYTPPDDFLFGKPTPNKIAYAGACFHDASPAPNALPLPKFFSKSVPTNTDGPSLSKMLAEAEAAPDTFDFMGASGRSRLPPMAPKTPLDIFFKADKEEKARKALQAASTNDIFSPKPSMTPAQEPRVVRQITPPTAAMPMSLGSPFGGKTSSRDDTESDRDMLFSMDFSDNKKIAPRPVEEVVTGPRHRPLSATAYDPETLVKRQEKAKELKAALMKQQLGIAKGLEIAEPPSPSPKPKAKPIPIPDTADGSGPISPTIQERRARANNVGFAPAPRIRHYNQNRPVNSRANGHHRGGRNPNFSSQPQNTFNNGTQNTTAQPPFDSVRARMGEAHIRGVLKLDSPIPAI